MRCQIEGVAEVLRSASKSDKTLRVGLRRAVSVAVGYGEDEAKNRAPFRTGALRDSIEGRMVPGGVNMFVGFVTANADHAIYVEEDTVPHPISAKDGGRLRFKTKDGSWASPKTVNHPGTTAQPFMAPAMPVIESTLRSRAQEAVDAAIAEF